LAEYAFKLYPTVEAESAILNSYRNAPFCTKIICDQYVVSPDKNWLAAVNVSDDIIRIYNYKGALQAKCTKQKGHIEYDCMRFSDDSKYLFSNSIADSTYRIWDLKGKPIFSYKGDAYTHLELFNNEIIVLEKDKFSVYDFSGKKKNEVLFNSKWTYYRFKDELLAIVTKDLKVRVYNLQSAKIISEKSLDKRYEIAGISANKEVLHIVNRYKNEVNRTYNIIWNFRNNTSMNFDIDTIQQISNSFKLYGNILLEGIRTQNNASYKIKDLDGKIIEKIPEGYILDESFNTEDLIIFNNETIKRYIVYNFNNNKLSLPFSCQLVKIHAHTAIVYGEKKEDIQEFKAIDLDKNIVVGEINSDISRITDIIPSLKVFVCFDKNKTVFANFNNKQLTSNHHLQTKNFGLLNKNYYLQYIDNDDYSGVKSCLIWKIDSTQFSNFDLNKKYSVSFDTIYVDVPGTLEQRSVVIKNERNPYFLMMGYSPDEKYIIVSDETTTKTTLWNRQGRIIKEIPFLSASYKFSKSGKYLALNSFQRDLDNPQMSELRLYSFPELKLLYSEPSKIAGIDFIEKGDTVCVIYAGNSIKYINNKYQKKNEWKIGNLHFNIYKNEIDNWLYIKDGLLYTQNINYKYHNVKVKVYNYLKRDSTILFSDSVKNFSWTHTLLTNNKNVIINLKNSIQVNDFKNNMLFNLKNKGDVSYIYPFNDSLLFVTYLFANEYRIVSPENPDTFRIGLRRTPNYFIEMWDIYNNKMLYKKGMAGSCENFSFYKERMLMNYGSDYLYADLKCNSIIEFQGEGNQRSAISPQGNYFVYLDNKNKRLVSFPLNPKEVIRRVRVDKEFGEMRQLTDEEKQEYGIDE
ncbi:MAG: hypothetical protein COZ21_08370, partial [Bacteroidetes bacterium CG_4_10_14_3_um_filter_31_20]